MKKLFIVLILIFFYSGQSFSFYLSDGLYESKLCFVFVESEGSLTKIKFAHKKNHPNISAKEFEDTKIIGTNIVYDRLKNKFILKPDSCNYSSVRKIKWSTDNGVTTIKCGHAFKNTRLKIQIETTEYGRITGLRYKMRESDARSGHDYTNYQCKNLYLTWMPDS